MKLDLFQVLMATFQFWDKDGSGTIDKEEWKEKMKHIPEISEAEFDKYWEEFDSDANGQLDQLEFANMLVKLMESHQQSILIQLLWVLADADKNGVISKDEILPWVKSFSNFAGDSVGEQNAQEFASAMEKLLAAEAGIGGNVDFEVFSTVMKNVLNEQ